LFCRARSNSSRSDLFAFRRADHLLITPLISCAAHKK
jgi:hypothetical protein